MAPAVPTAFATAPEDRACAGIRMDLANCLLRTDCVLKQGNTPAECLTKHIDELAEECQFLRKSLTQCKRGMLDMRKRFRGNPSTTNNRKEGVPSVSIIGVNAHKSSVPGGAVPVSEEK
ncbi:Cytochrome c oxidase assembly protein PET191 [Phaffia rhodozyma]|uniref:Cytochrome c oxidase assembly protein PET191 n=1 Tax=Phaffia rhodozyma TaxID=264483 RepID=A0A0F7SQS5_PHARH|nr:Cytochrome c oxidase assembly protein PET191 [Phaffia rhodozyma]